MKIYFAGSIRGGRDDSHIYFEIIKELQKYGEVLTEHIGDPNLTMKGESLSESEIHDRDMNWVFESDVIFAEVTQTSMGVGYEIGRAVEAGKKVIAVYREMEGKRISAMIAGSDKLTLVKYSTIEEIKEILKSNF